MFWIGLRRNGRSEQIGRLGKLRGRLKIWKLGIREMLMISFKGCLARLGFVTPSITTVGQRPLGSVREPTAMTTTSTPIPNNPTVHEDMAGVR